MHTMSSDVPEIATEPKGVLRLSEEELKELEKELTLSRERSHVRGIQSHTRAFRGSVTNGSAAAG
jgi:hypothetical protein